MDWQTPASLIIVALTVVWFVRRWLKRRSRPASGCGGSCGCSVAKRSHPSGQR